MFILVHAWEILNIDHEIQIFSEVLEARDPELPRNSVWLHTMTMVLDKYVPVELPHPSALVPDDKKSGTFSVLLARFKF